MLCYIKCAPVRIVMVMGRPKAAPAFKTIIYFLCRGDIRLKLRLHPLHYKRAKNNTSPKPKAVSKLFTYGNAANSLRASSTVSSLCGCVTGKINVPLLFVFNKLIDV